MSAAHPEGQKETGRQKGATTEQLRDDIDSGRTGDKVKVGDPAAAPLGTDEEAAASPPHPADVEAVRRSEGGLGQNPPAPVRQLLPTILVIVAVLALVLAMLFGWR